MSTARRQELAARRAALLERSSAEREVLAEFASDIKGRLLKVDQSIAMVKSIAKKPTVIAGAAALLALIGPRRILHAATRSATFLVTGKRLFRWWRGSRRGGPLLRSP